MSDKAINSDRINILLTGATRGLGLFLAKRLHEANFRVIGLDLPAHDELSQEAKDQLEGYYSFDLTHINDIKSLISRIISENQHIDILINNAGLKSFRKLEDYETGDFSKVMDVNFMAPALLSKEVAVYMARQNYGRIIHIASNAGFEGYSKGTAYCSSKGALHLFTQAYSKELPGSVTINAVSPSSLSSLEPAALTGTPAPGSLIDPARVFTSITRIINSGVTGQVIPIISLRDKLGYLYRDMRKHFTWLTKY
ncbi:MAG: SDR family oxidoreductase [Bacteroidetes bacterium]|nr:SDR family oxidoreductase [Bacteroidota bacterium]